MKLKKHKDTIFKSFRENKKEMKRQDYCMKRDAKWAEYWTPEKQREYMKQQEWAFSCRISGIGEFFADNPILLEMHRQKFFQEWERKNPIENSNT